MKVLKKIWQFFQFDTNGNIALAAFVICAVSGVIIAIPFDVLQAYDSISLMLITNPGAVFFRNLHYWSAQIFLIFTLLHLWDYFKPEPISKLNSGLWYRLVLTIVFVFFVMLSGFILKADADSLQARRILESLITDIPLVGGLISGAVFGTEDSLQLIYVHHIATATIFLIYIIFEHVKTLWTKISTFLITLAVLTILSLFMQAPLHDNLSPIVKGPWYFTGLQEILHWMGNPALIWILILLLLSGIFFMRIASAKANKAIRKLIIFFTLVYAILTIIGFYFRGENWQWENPWDRNQETNVQTFEIGFNTGNKSFSDLTARDIPVIRGRREACMVCHQNLTGFSASHNPEAIGCTSCHQGKPFSLNKNKAHQNMVLIPGNLNLAAQTCGTTDCHPDIPDRVNKSLMTTNSGIVSVNRWVFNEAETPDQFEHIRQIGQSPADQHLRNLCAKCHLGNPKIETGPINELSRGGGCTACHLNYTDAGRKAHYTYVENDKAEDHLPKVHPSLDINISNEHCFGCHSRSGRISTNYEGWHETLLEEYQIADNGNYRILLDKRVFEFISEDVHHKAGLDCIDCHNSYETMGDGETYQHEEQAVKIQCEDCHFTSTPQLVDYDQLDTESKKIFDLRRFSHQDKRMIRGKESEVAIINTFLENDSAFLISKNKGTKHLLNAPPTICTREAHQSLTCSACHTAWAPQCIGCHNEFDKNAAGYDLLANQPLTGTWVEFVGSFIADAPTLGVWEGEQKKVSPAIPGMVLTVDKSGISEKGEDIIFKRLFAPAAPHTTSVKGRNCKSCHNNPLAIGYGRGDLAYKIENGTGIWTFIPYYAANQYDGLPEDAWIAFPAFSQEDSQQHMDSSNPNLIGSPQHMANANPNLIGSRQHAQANLSGWVATRANFRPFTLAEQKRILRVGACLTCHNENSDIMSKSLEADFEEYFKGVSKECILPF